MSLSQTSSTENVNLLRELGRAELRVMLLVATEASTKEIADRLGSSPDTVRTHRNNIRRKLGLKRGQSLVGFALLHWGILQRLNPDAMV